MHPRTQRSTITPTHLTFVSLSLLLMFAESLRDYFSQFGEITEVMVMKDPTTRRTRYVPHIHTHTHTIYANHTH